MMAAAPPPHKAAAVDILSDHGLWLRSIHVVSGVGWVGLLWFLDACLAPSAKQLDGDTSRALWQTILPRALWWLRWGAASTWITGMGYASYLGAQSEQGLLGWFHGPLRGKWIGMGFLLATAMVFHIWFIAWPAQARHIAAARRGEPTPDGSGKGNGDDDGWTVRRAVSPRFAVYLSIPLLITMQAGKHGGELTGILPTDFVTAAAVVLIGGAAVAALLSHVVAPRVGR